MNCPGLAQCSRLLATLATNPSTAEQRLRDASVIRATAVALRGHGWITPRYLSFDTLATLVRVADQLHALPV